MMLPLVSLKPTLWKRQINKDIIHILGKISMNLSPTNDGGIYSIINLSELTCYKILLPSFIHDVEITIMCCRIKCIAYGDNCKFNGKRKGIVENDLACGTDISTWKSPFVGFRPFNGMIRLAFLINPLRAVRGRNGKCMRVTKGHYLVKHRCGSWLVGGWHQSYEIRGEKEGKLTRLSRQYICLKGWNAELIVISWLKIIQR